MPGSLLAEGWALAGRTAPAWTPLESEAGLPEDVRDLMTARDGMTAALGRRWGTPVGLRLLARRVENHALLRLVVLERPGDRLAVEIAVIRIDLNAIGPRAALRSLVADAPFGTVLAETGIDFRSTPLGYFRITADAALAEWGRIPEGSRCWGRSAELRNDGGRVLAQAVEVLPRW